MIGLKDFVKEALVQVSGGVAEAQDALAESKTKINPPASGDVGSLEGSYQVSHRKVAHMVEFDLPVSFGDDGLVVAIESDASQPTARLRFKVGIAFPQEEFRSQPSGGQFELEV